MKTIGLIGGMSWESTQAYYRIINETVKARLGGLHSAKILLSSLDFAEMAALQRDDHWLEIGRKLAHEARRLENTGAACIILATNTMHKVADQIEAAITHPFLHIADATAHAVKQKGIHRVGLLGTKYTMEQEFYAGRLAQSHGLEVLVPDVEEREQIHQAIYQELCLGRFMSETRTHFLRIIDGLASRGAEGIVLGCTEIGLLVTQADCRLPLFDTAHIHAEAAVDFALEHVLKA